MNFTHYKHLESTVLAAPYGICILNAQTLTIELVNEKFVRIAGKPYDKISGHFYWDVFPEARPFFEGKLNSAIETGEPYHEEGLELLNIRPTRDDNIVVNLTYSPVKDESAEVKKVAVWISETTKQVREKQELQIIDAAVRKERDRLNEFLMQAPAGICIVSGPDLVYEVVNPAYQSLLPGRQLLHRPMFEALPELAGSQLHQVLSQVYQTGTSSRTDELLIPVARFEGDPIPDRYFSFTYQPRRNAQGEVEGILIFVYEVTEMVEARKKAEDRERHFKHLADLVPAKISNALPTGEVTFINKQWLDYSGLSFEEFRDFGYHEMMHPEEIETFQKGLAHAASSGIPYESEIRFKDKEGKYRWHLNIASPILDDKGQIIMWVGSTTDIQRIKEEDQRKTDFIGMVSHELKTPLTSLSAYLQLLQAKFKSPETSFEAQAMQRAQKQVNKMTSMINGFLNVGRLESAEIQINKQPFDLIQLLRETEQEVNAMTSSHTIHFTPACVARVRADRDKIGQVLHNLLSNAIKYSGSGTDIHVTCEADTDNVIVAVADQGMGISKENITNVFNRYFRVENNDTISGFGIGLYLCAEIIKRHGGKIWAESETGKGSTFYFSLPVSL